MLGFLGLLLLNAKKVADHVKEHIGLSLVVAENAKENDIIKLQKTIDRQDFAKDTRYISKEDAAKSLTETLGEDFVTFLGYNPLEASIEVHVKAAWANNDSLQMIKTWVLSQSKVIKEVQYQETLVQAINNNISQISLIIIGFSAVLLLISLALINNTIRLYVYAKRFIIRTMQLVGATEAFIRRPFVRRGIWQGFISAIIAILAILATLYVAQGKIPELIDLRSPETTLILFGIVIVLGIVMSWTASYFSVRKYLRSNIDNLYY
ncbi:permease-like cell division protein FtsX, partial [Bacteroidales bacterium OttesenSCG-928-J16]|nr:permease-like cell division protein FtsX [Bacteroidales bacterium OttesenSCG-928-J16]